MSFLDLGTSQLTTGNDHKVFLRCLRKLKELEHVEICGMAKVAREYLEKTMRLSK